MLVSISPSTGFAKFSTQEPMISKTQQHDIHADAMARTACLYDELIRSNSPLTCNPLNSCSPNVWLHDACLSGGIWGPKTEFTESAIAILHSYRFQTRYRMLRYAAIGPKNKRGDDVFCGFLSCETKSLVFESCVINEDDSSHYFTDDGKPQSASKGSDLHEDFMEHPAFAYGLVSEQDLDAAYAEYLAGDRRADEVANSVLDFVRRKLAMGTKEYGLVQRGADDLIGQFWQQMYKAILAKRFRADNGSAFHHYVKSSWSNLRNSAYRDLAREDKHFESSTVDHSNADEDFGSNSGHEDSYASALHNLVKVDTRREADIRVHDLMARLTGMDLAIAQSLLAGFSTSQTAERVFMSRHSVRRVEKKLVQSMQKADRVRNGRAS